VFAQTINVYWTATTTNALAATMVIVVVIAHHAHAVLAVTVVHATVIKRFNNTIILGKNHELFNNVLNNLKQTI